MKRISEHGKKREGRGRGAGVGYKPYIQCREFNSLGTCSTPIDWKTGRTVELLSQAEKAVWYLLRWEDDVVDILEQYPLDLSKTVALAEAYGIQHPKDTRTRMTTDFLVVMKDGTRNAVSVKADERDLKNKRTVEKLFLEKTFWENEGVPFVIMLKSRVNMTKVHNIRMVTEFYDPTLVFDDMSALKHLIARKVIRVDMESAPLDFPGLLRENCEVVRKWMDLHSLLQQSFKKTAYSTESYIVTPR